MLGGLSYPCPLLRALATCIGGGYHHCRCPLARRRASHEKPRNLLKGIGQQQQQAGLVYVECTRCSRGEGERRGGREGWAGPALFILSPGWDKAASEDARGSFSWPLLICGDGQMPTPLSPVPIHAILVSACPSRLTNGPTPGRSDSA